jgi:RNA polymerase sigma-70 factor (ECF subfamily)
MSRKFRSLVKKHEHQVYTLGVYLLRDRSEAEDVAQETYMKLWNNLDNIDNERAAAWLMKVTRNACLDRLRKRRPETEVNDYHLGTDQVQEPAEAFEQEQLGSWLRGAIANLKEPYRSLVVLRDVQQNSYRDVAQALELSLDQVKVYLHRARRQLRDNLQEVRT